MALFITIGSHNQNTPQHCARRRGSVSGRGMVVPLRTPGFLRHRGFEYLDRRPERARRAVPTLQGPPAADQPMDPDCGLTVVSPLGSHTTKVISGRTGFRGYQLMALAIVGVGSVAPTALAAQSEEDAAAALGGAAVGAYSGAILELIGGLSPCNRTIRGTRCVRAATVLGGLVGSTSGAVLSYHAPDALDDRLHGAGLGALVGAAFGYGLKVGIRQYDWPDVSAAAAVGAALGASPVGAGIGFGVGLTVGSVLWLAVPGRGMPEAATLSLAGLAIGGLVDWVLSAATAGGGSGPLVIPFQIRY